MDRMAESRISVRGDIISSASHRIPDRRRRYRARDRERVSITSKHGGADQCAISLLQIPPSLNKANSLFFAIGAERENGRVISDDLDGAQLSQPPTN